MEFYFAPLEGLTDRIYRRLHQKYFPGLDRYYLPFLSPTVHRALTPKEAKEIPPADSLGYCAIPQLLTKNAEDFSWMAGQCKDMGYREVNLNLGCPSGTVTAKGKGSGMLRDLDGLDSFLYEIFHQAPLPISVKTRIGFTEPEEFAKLLEIYNRYPISQLTIHPRVRAAFYKGTVHMDWFRYAVENAKMPLCYNGDLRSKADISAFSQKYPQIQSVMIGRGLIGNPGMLTQDAANVDILEQFLTELLENYVESFGGARNAMFRLKEHWSYLLPNFANNEKLSKQLRKCTDVDSFKSITGQILHTLSWLPTDT